MLFEKSTSAIKTAILIGLSLLMTMTAQAADQSTAQAKGKMYLVSTGTGDADNMTIRARDIITRADILFAMGGGREQFAGLLKGKEVHDAGHGLFGMGSQQKKPSRASNKPAEKAKAAKQAASKRPRKSPEELAQQQEETRKIIRDGIAAGKTVVILDNGDPMIFGPHAGYLREFADLSPVVIPGPSSFNAANAALKSSVVGGPARGVTLTHARLDDGRDQILAKMISDGFTLAFFMVRNLDEFVATLGKNLPETTPVAIVANAGSSAQERVIRATLGTVTASVKAEYKEEKLPSYLLYVGEAVQ